MHLKISVSYGCTLNDTVTYSDDNTSLYLTLIKIWTSTSDQTLLSNPHPKPNLKPNSTLTITTMINLSYLTAFRNKGRRLEQLYSYFNFATHIYPTCFHWFCQYPKQDQTVFFFILFFFAKSKISTWPSTLMMHQRRRQHFTSLKYLGKSAA